MSESSGSKGFSAGLKRLSKHSGIYALGTAINKATGFLLIPFVTAYIGTRTNYGVKEIAEVTLVISGHLLGVNLLHGMTRYYADYEEGQQRTTLISTCMLLLAATTGLAMLVGLAFAETFAGLLFGSAEYADAFRVVVAILFFQCLGQVGLRYLQIVEKSGTYVVLTLAKLLIEVGLKVYLMVALQMTYMGVILPVLIGEGLLGGGTLVFLLWRFRAAFSMEIAKRLIRYSYPLVASGLCMFVLHQADRFFLRFFHGLDAVGVYGLSYKLGYMVNALVFDSFALIWFPFIFGIKEEERVKFMMRKVLSYFTFGVSFISLGVALFSREVVYVMASEEFFEAHRAIPLIVLGYVFFYYPQRFLEDPTFLIRIWDGGMAFHGGLLGVAAAMLWYALRTQRTFFQVADFGAPLVTLQRRIAKLERTYVLSGWVLGLPWWLLWIPMAIVGLTLGGIDIFRNAPSGWILINVLVGVAGMLATVGIYRWARRSPNERIRAKVLRLTRGEHLDRANLLLRDLEAFEQA